MSISISDACSISSAASSIYSVTGADRPAMGDRNGQRDKRDGQQLGQRNTKDEQQEGQRVQQ